MGRLAAGYGFVAPALLLMVVILLVPVGFAGYLSFTDYNLGATDYDYVGWKHYDKILELTRETRCARNGDCEPGEDTWRLTRYGKMFWATFAYVLIVVPVSFALGLGAAMLINSVKRFGDFYKTIYFLPVMAALLAMAIVWEFTLHPTIGIVNKTLASGCDLSWLRSWSWYDHGCEDGFPLWLGNKDYALGTLIFIGVWQSFGFNMVLFLAGLTSIPRDLYHAAAMDGARTGWDRFRLVTWPMLGPTTVFVVTITSIRSFQVFDTVEALTEGGPSQATYMMMYALYEKGIEQDRVGIGAAITVMFLAFVLLLTLFQQRLVERKVHYA